MLQFYDWFFISINNMLMPVPSLMDFIGWYVLKPFKYHLKSLDVVTQSYIQSEMSLNYKWVQLKYENKNVLYFIVMIEAHTFQY